MTMKDIIDVSRYQGTIDWNQVKSHDDIMNAAE